MDERANVGNGRGQGSGEGTEGLARGRGRGRGRSEFVEKNEVFAKSNAGEVPSTDNIAYTSVEEVNDEEEQVYLVHGFVNPGKVTIPALSDSIMPGDKVHCMLHTINDTKSMYLHFAKNFARLDDFIAATGRWYEKQIRLLNRSDMVVRNDQLRPGAMVVVCHKEKGSKEWKRAKILESFQSHEGRGYRVLLLDLGDEVDILLHDIYYMHVSFVKQPQFAIRAQLRFSSKYEGTYTEHYGWNYKVCRELLKTVLNQQILVKFIRKDCQQEEQSWEVTLLSMPFARLSTGQPIEQQVVAELMETCVFRFF